jgi:hypothetical protein
VKRDDQETDAIRRGRLLEPVAVQILREDHPDWEMDHNSAENRYFRDPARRIGATPDVTVVCPRRGRGVVQIKSVEAGIYRRKWLDEDGNPEAPLWISLQALQEAYLTGAQWAAVCPLVIGFGVEAPLIDVPLDDMPGVIEAITAKASEFWQMVEEDREPPIDFDRDAGALDRIYAVGDPREEADLTSDEDILDTIARLRGAKDDLLRAEAAKVRHEAEIKAKMGTAELAHLPTGQKLKWPTYRRRDAATGSVTTYRRLLLPRD